MCLLVCLLVCFLSAARHLPTLRRCLRVAERAGAVVAGGPARAGKRMHLREHARACRTASLRKNRCADQLMPFKNKSVRARMLSYTYLPRVSKKGKKETNMPLHMFSLQFAFSWSVYFSNRTESYSSRIEFAGPHLITENQATSLHCGGEARAKKRARPPATCRKASRGKTGADTGPEDVDVDCLRSSQARA